MILYNWMDQLEQPFILRYSDPDKQILGRKVFKDLAKLLTNEKLELSEIIRSFDAIALKAWQCPRLFISHRKVDAVYAERIAWLAAKQGWDYWLDVHDPSLRAINSVSPSTKSQALAVALVIEVALLNCTHVIAPITSSSAGSAWIPYEYGRVKPNSIASQVAACWLHPSQSITPAEYMNLGPIFYTEQAINNWLSTEKSKFKNCLQLANDFHGDEKESPAKLPT